MVNIMRKKIIIIICIVSLTLSSCYQYREIAYYSQKENYIQAKGTVSHIKYNDDYTMLCIAFSKTEPKFDDNNFQISGENLSIVRAKGIDQKLEIGKEISFMTAPRYFGDGYFIPIVSLSIDGEEILGFEEGYYNLMNYLKK